MSEVQPLKCTWQRVRILKALLETDNPMSARDVAQASGVALNSVSYSLRYMEDAGWLYAPGQPSERRPHVRRYYRLTRAALPDAKRMAAHAVP